MNEVKWKESLLLNDNQKRKPKQYERIHERYMAFLQVYVLAEVEIKECITHKLSWIAR